MSLESQIYQCSIDFDKYKKLKNQLEWIVTYLTNAKKSGIDVKNKVTNLYQINDDNSSINGRVLNLINNIENTCNTINNTIIPAIDSAMNNVSNQKYNLQQEKQKQDDLARRKEN